jgi:hypothetical protein
MWFQKLLDIGDFIGVRGTVLKRKWEKSQFMWIDGFGKALKPLPVVKRMQMENL